MSTIINHQQPEDEGNAPRQAERYARFAAAVDEAAQWYAGGLPPDPLPTADGAR